MVFKSMNRHLVVAAIVICYLVPLLFFSIYSITLMSHHKSWALLSLGLLLIALGTLSLIILLFYWERSFRAGILLVTPPRPHSPPHSEDRTAKVTQLDPTLFEAAKPSVETPTEGMREVLHPAKAGSPKVKQEPELYPNKRKNWELGLAKPPGGESEELSLENKTDSSICLGISESPDQAFQKLEEKNERLEQKAGQIAQDFLDYKLFSEEQLRQKQSQLTALQQIIEDQRTEMERRQEQIYQLDAKIHELGHEIKTVLYLDDSMKKEALVGAAEEASKSIKTRTKFQSHPKNAQGERNSDIKSNEWKDGDLDLYPNKLKNPGLGLDKAPRFDHLETGSYCNMDPLLDVKSGDLHLQVNSHSVQSPEEARLLLKRHVEATEKLTGAHYCIGKASRYREFSPSYYAMDRRRLFEQLRNETTAMLIVYSKKEQRLLFVNNHSKVLLGWSPKKFLSDFPLIMREGIKEWTRALQLLDTQAEIEARLLGKTKDGHEILLHCCLGIISKGLFRQHILGVLYPE